MTGSRVLGCPHCGTPLGVEAGDFLHVGAALLNSRTRLICVCCRSGWGWRPGDLLRAAQPAPDNALDTPPGPCVT